MKKTKEPKNNSLDDALDVLAMDLAEELRNKEVPRDERISGFSKLVIYWSLKHKLPPPPDDSKGAFGGFRDKISGLSAGGKSSASDSGDGPDF